MKENRQRAVAKGGTSHQDKQWASFGSSAFLSSLHRAAKQFCNTGVVTKATPQKKKRGSEECLAPFNFLLPGPCVVCAHKLVGCHLQIRLVSPVLIPEPLCSGDGNTSPS